EWQLRAVNLLWAGLAGTAVGLIGRRLRQPGLLWLFLLHPFLWYYLNEARPYALQIFASAWLLYVLTRAHTRAALDALDLWVLVLATIGGLGSSLLFTFALPGVLVSALLIWRRHGLNISWTPWCWLPLITGTAAMGVCGVYYLLTLIRGATGAKI